MEEIKTKLEDLYKRAIEKEDTKLALDIVGQMLVVEGEIARRNKPKL